MTMTRQKDLIADFRTIVEHPYKRLAQLKQQSKTKMMGCVIMNIPEELVHAAGFLPVTPLGLRGRIPHADQHMQPQVCPPVRGNLELALSGDLDFLDGVIFSDACDPVKNVSDVWVWLRPETTRYHLRVPRSLVPAGSDRFLKEELFRLKTWLEKVSGQEVTDRKLAASISLYNRHRALLKRLYELRSANPGVLSMKDVATIIAASKFMPKEEHIKLLEPLIEQLGSMKAQPDGRVRLLVSQPVCQDVPPEVLSLIEELGASIPDDDCFIGYRSFGAPVREDGSPMDALAEVFIKGLPCVTRQDPNNDLARYVADKASRAEARGVVVFMPKYCEPMGFAYLWLSTELSKAGIPTLLLELDQEPPSLAAFRVRLEAFIEMIKEA